MGLDVQLYRLPDFDTNKVVLYSEKSNQIWICAQQGKKVPLTEQESAELSKRSEHLALKMGLPSDIDEQIEQKKQEVSLPSVKYPEERQIGYWNSGYGGGGIDTILKAAIGRGLYDAFPEAKRRGYYIKPNWQRSHKVLYNMLTRFRANGPENRKFLKAISYTVGLGPSFLAATNPSATNPPTEATETWRAMVSFVQERLTPESMFTGYVRELESIIETVEYVFTQPDEDQYILSWGA